MSDWYTLNSLLEKAEIDHHKYKYLNLIVLGKIAFKFDDNENLVEVIEDPKQLPGPNDTPTD